MLFITSLSVEVHYIVAVAVVVDNGVHHLATDVLYLGVTEKEKIDLDFFYNSVF